MLRGPYGTKIPVESFLARFGLQGYWEICLTRNIVAYLVLETVKSWALPLKVSSDGQGLAICAGFRCPVKLSGSVEMFCILSERTVTPFISSLKRVCYGHSYGPLLPTALG